MSNFGNPGLGFPYSYRQQLLGANVSLGISSTGLLNNYYTPNINSNNLNAEQQIVLPKGSSDSFAQGDPVFYDYYSGDALNLNKMPSNLALEDGPFTSDAFGQSNGVIPIFLSDNSYILITISDTNEIIATKYSPNGNVLYSNTVNSASSVLIGATELANGNIVIAFTSTNTSWIIISPFFIPLYTSNFVASVGIKYLQPLIGGGFVAFHSKGITTVSATGVANNIYTVGTGDSMYFGSQSEYVFDVNKLTEPAKSNLLWQASPGVIFSISNGGFGCIAYGSFEFGVMYIQINADGSLRSSPVILHSEMAGINGVRFSCDPISGNIAWIISSGTSGYGIVADNGSIVLAATTEYITFGGGLYNSPLGDVIQDGNGNFVFICTGANTNVVIYANSAGVLKSGYPQVLSSDVVYVVGLYRLSTGIVVIHKYRSNNVYTIQFIFIDGTFGEVSSIPTTSNCTVFNDTLFGVINTLYAYYDIFSYTNNGIFIINSIGSELVSLTGGKILIDSSGDTLWVVGGGSGTTYFGMHSIKSLVLIQSYTASITYSVDTILNNYEYTFVNFDYSDSKGGSLYFIKPRSTILLGVADKATASNASLTIDTSGLFPTTWYYSGTFDQSSNTPPGNKGWFGNTIVKLEGF